jgi:hypothetical protein
MAESDRRSSTAKLVLIMTAAAAVFALVAIVVFSTRREAQNAPTPPPPAPAPAAEPAQVAPPAAPVLSRADLIEAAGAAASAYASGANATSAEPTLAGRRFRVVLSFGCNGPQTRDSGDFASWSAGQDGGTIRISIRPQIWTDSSFVRELGGSEEIEAVQGFWIPRPWMASEDCPAQMVDPLEAAPPPPSPQTLGLAVFRKKGDSRLGSRDEHPYETVIKAPAPGQPAAPQGFRLVLEGRLDSYADGSAVRCRSVSPDQRPVCLFRVDLGRVAVVDPVSGQQIAEWRD